MKLLLELMNKKQPHLVVLNGEGLEALRLADDIRRMIENAVVEGNFPKVIPVEITNNDAAKVYMNSRLSMVPILL